MKLTRCVLPGLAIAGVLLVAGCSSLSSMFSSDPRQPPGEATVAANTDEEVGKLYNEALTLMNNRDFKKAAAKFEEVERQHPYSSWARRAILMTAYSNYARNAYPEAIGAAQRFIALHPGNEHAAYAYYLIGLSYYEQITDVGRDQEMTERALAALEEVVRRFPGTLYAKDAEAKALLARDHLAGKEMEIGRYYLNRHAYVAAINRFKKVVTDYQQTSHTPEALQRLTEAYMALGIKSEAQTAAAVLGHNFPSSEWYEDAYKLIKSDGLEPREDKESWISKAFNTILPF